MKDISTKQWLIIIFTAIIIAALAIFSFNNWKKNNKNSPAPTTEVVVPESDVQTRLDSCMKNNQLYLDLLAAQERIKKLEDDVPAYQDTIAKLRKQPKMIGINPKDYNRIKKALDKLSAQPTLPQQKVVNQAPSPYVAPSPTYPDFDTSLPPKRPKATTKYEGDFPDEYSFVTLSPGSNPVYYLSEEAFLSSPHTLDAPQLSARMDIVPRLVQKNGKNYFEVVDDRWTMTDKEVGEDIIFFKWCWYIGYNPNGWEMYIPHEFVKPSQEDVNRKIFDNGLGGSEWRKKLVYRLKR